ERQGLATGIGDDVAVLEDGRVVTQDTLVEGVHFRLDWMSWRGLGSKAPAGNLRDLPPGGAEPGALLLRLGPPAEAPVGQVLELYTGLAEPGVAVVGGDTTRADRTYLTVTAIGRSDRVPGRAGARPGDALVVTGPLGASAAGYYALRAGTRGAAADAHLRPPIRLAEGRGPAHGAHATPWLSERASSAR